MKKYIAYYRVSTARQGESGLGIDGQREAIRAYADSVISEYTEIESGKNDMRPKLQAAIAEARKTGATLLIAKLDRLSRNVGFIARLQESNIAFVCADMPDATELTINIFAAIAQDERKRISERTRSALAAKKARGERLGSEKIAEVAALGRPVALKVRREKSKEANAEVASLVRSFRKHNLSDNQIATELNAQGRTTQRGKAFRHDTVKAIRMQFEIN